MPSPIKAGRWRVLKMLLRPAVDHPIVKAASIGFALAAFLMPGLSAATSADSFYHGKSIRLLIGFGPGGGYDQYARVFARHFGRHVPGNPTIVPQNMPGAGGLAVANYLFNVAPPDGLTIGMFGPFDAMEPLFGNRAARFDPTKVPWLGKMGADAGACGSWKSAHIKRLSGMRDRKVVFGSSGPSSTTTQQVLALKNLLGAKVEIIQGYKGSQDIMLAMRRGEVKAMCGIAAANVLVQLRGDIDNGNMRIFVQFGRKNVPEFRGADNIYDLLATDDDKRIADIIFQPNEFGKPLASTPGLPAERLELLRNAFQATMADPALLNEMRRDGLPVQVEGGAEISNAFEKIYSTPRRLIDRAMKVMSSE